VVGDVAGVVGFVASVVGASADVDEEVIGTDQIYASSVVMATKSEMMAILFVWEVVRTPPTWRATVDDS